MLTRRLRPTGSGAILRAQIRQPARSARRHFQGSTDRASTRGWKADGTWRGYSSPQPLKPARVRSNQTGDRQQGTSIEATTTSLPKLLLSTALHRRNKGWLCRGSQS
ncbi:unnamed protein product [Ixodes pacificus]